MVETDFIQYKFAASIPFILSNAFAKASVVIFVTKISPQRRIHMACYALLATVVAWALAGIFGLAFECQLSSLWALDDDTCVNRWALYLVLGVLNMITDIALIVIPVFMMWSIQTKATIKWQVLALFALRILYVHVALSGDAR